MRSKMRILATSVVLGLAACAGYATVGGQASAGPVFGTPEDVSYAKQLWQELSAARLVGPDTILTRPYKGTPPHGDVLEVVMGKVTVNGHTGTVLVKKNYYGDGLEIPDVMQDPGEYLQSITVMFKREAGYDPEDLDWFWVKYTPDGKLMSNPKGLKLAGRVAKGAPKGCISCHKSAEGGDMVYQPFVIQ